MKTYQIAVIPGDGIGPEVMREAVKVLNAVSALDGGFNFEFTEYPWGCEYYLKTGEMMPEDGLERLKGSDAILLGAVGYPGVPDHISLRGLLLKLRRGFDQYVNLRPVKLLEGAPCPLKDVKPGEIDMVFVRENALNYSMVFWDQVFEEVGREYPDVETQSLLVDAAAMFMIKNPKRFQVVVTSNLFGDILTDLGAAISGGMGLAAGANLDPERRYPSMFEPIHGSAPKHAGKGDANPLASIWAAGQLLDHLGYPDWYGKIVDTVERMLKEKQGLTKDLGGSASTSECGDVFVKLLG